MIVELGAARTATDPAARTSGAVGHRSRRSTAEAVLEASGPSLTILFDEAGMALAELTAGADAGAPASSWESIELEAADLDGLAVAWLNELMRAADGHRAELVDVAVDVVAAPEAAAAGWRLRGRAGLRRVGDGLSAARPWLRATVWPRVASSDGRWTLRARLRSSPDGLVDRDPAPDEPGSDGLGPPREGHLRAG